MLNRFKIIEFVLLLVLFLGSSPFQSFARTRIKLSTLLERNLVNLEKAVKSGDLKIVKRQVSSELYRRIENNLKSVGRELSIDIFKSMVESMKPSSEDRLVRTLRKGPTAALVYFAEIAEKDVTGAPRIRFLYLKFVEEDGLWRFGGGANIGNKKFDEKGNLNKFSLSMIDDESLKLDGLVKSPQEPLKKVFAVGSVTADSYGYATEVFVNGESVIEVRDKVSFAVIKGGLKKGTNTIRVKSLALQKKSFDLEVRVFKGSGGKKVNVFDKTFTSRKVSESYQFVVENP